jgi:hypothetical protein
MLNYFTELNTEDFSQETLDKMNNEMQDWIDENIAQDESEDVVDLINNAKEKIFNKYC